MIHRIYSTVTSFEHSGSVGIMVGLLWVRLLWLVSMNCCLGRIRSLMVSPTCLSVDGPMWLNGTLFNSTVGNTNVLIANCFIYTSKIFKGIQMVCSIPFRQSLSIPLINKEPKQYQEFIQLSYHVYLQILD